MNPPALLHAKPARRAFVRFAGWPVVALATVLALPAAAAEPRAAQFTSAIGATPRLDVGPNESSIARRIDLSVGRSLVVDLPREAKEIFVANPKVANAVVRSAKKLFVIGIADGATSIFALDADGRQIAAMEITVGRDLATLRSTLRATFPSARLEIRPAGNSVLLTGEVDSALDAQRAVDIANAFVAVDGGGDAAGGGGKGAVVNGLSIRGKDQVMLKVTVAEVSRQIIKQLGVNITSNWAALTGVVDNPFTIATQTLSNTALTATGQGPNRDVSATVKALERNGVTRVLAEPTLTAISGESAKFTAGGEVPIPKGQSCSFDLFGRQQCTISIDYKPVGVKLQFLPTVLSEGRISLRVSTEVTDIDASNQLNLGTINVVAFKVRSTDTTIELPSGGSMAVAGLIQQSSKQAINGLPGLMNLPILGALFKSRDYQRDETELMIIVTPYIAKPVAISELAKPDDGFVEATDPQTILLGRLNKLYGVAGAPINGRGTSARVGFIND